MAKKKKQAKKKKTSAKKKKVGRPTKYKQEFCEEIVKFFDQPAYEDIELPHYDSEGNVTWIDKKRMAGKLPTLVGFARHIGVGYSTLKDWMDKEHASYQQEFSAIVTRVVKVLQKEHLIQNGLQGLYNPQAFKFVATNITDMRDQTGLNLGGPDGEPLEITITVKNGA